MTMKNGVIMPKILIVENDPHAPSSFSALMQGTDFTVKTCMSGQEALTTFEQEPANLCLLGPHLAQQDAIALMQSLHQKAAILMVITTYQTDETAEINALNAGADDFIVKPISEQRLHARLRALLRRAGTDISTRLICGDLMLDTAQRSATWQNHPLPLTKTEFALLHEFVKRPGFIKSRDQLAAAINRGAGAQARAVDSHIKRLRNKISQIDSRFDAIETLYGAGYRYKND